MTLDLFEERPDIWRGGLTPPENTKTNSTGFAQLDKKLTGGGWPTGAITEILCGDDGIPPLWLIMPALASMSRQSAWITWVAPPFVPYAPALHAIGVELSRIMLVHARSQGREITEDHLSSDAVDNALRDDLSTSSTRQTNSRRQSHQHQNSDSFSNICWALEQALKSGTASAVLGWLNNDNPRVLRRLQIAAETGGTTGFIFRPKRYAAQQSNAALRLYVDLHPLGLTVKVLKCRGHWTNSDEPIRVLFDQLPTYPVNSQPIDQSASHSDKASIDKQYSITQYSSPQPYIAKKNHQQLSLNINSTVRSASRQTIDGEKVIKAAHKNTNSNARTNQVNQHQVSKHHAGRSASRLNSGSINKKNRTPQQLSNGLDTILDLFASHKT